MKRLTEECGLVYVLKPGDYQAGSDGDSFCMDKYGHFAIIFAGATYTDNGGNGCILKVYSGAADATKTTAETFNYRYADADQAAASADQFSDWATSAALEFDAATFGDRILVVEMNAAELTAGQPYVTVEIGAEGTALNLSAVAILTEPKWSGYDMPTAIPTA
jgi:hypothetical protein